MPVAAQSRGKVTDTHGPYEVGGFAVCRVGGIVALHLGTPAGRFVFHVRERSFVKHARAERDENGHPFRTLQEIDRARAVAEQEAEEVAAAAAAAAAPRKREPLCGGDAAWEFFTAHLHWSVANVAAHFGIPYQVFAAYIAKHHPREVSRLRREAGLSCRGCSSGPSLRSVVSA